MKMASEFSGLNFNELGELDCITYLTLVRDGFIYRMRQTEEGRDYLEQCYLLKQTTPNKESLRSKFGG